MTSRSWCFTINNWTPDEWEQATSLRKKHGATWFIVGREVGAEGTPHLQGAVTFAKPIRMSALKKLLPRAHLEPMKGKEIDSTKYCSKDGAFVEEGERTSQGTRSDLKDAHKYAREGKALTEFLALEPGYQALKVYELAKGAFPPKESPRTVIWLWGAAGVGKSRAAAAAGAYFMDKDGSFWTSYHGQTTVCLDELRPRDLSRRELLRLLDRYPYQISIKGRTEWWRATTIYITSCLHPQIFWSGMKGDDEPWEQLERRITEVRLIEPPSTPVSV